MPGPILFVSHDATRTGAPIALLNLLTQFARRGEPRFEVLLRGGGPLDERFAALARVTDWSGPELRPAPATASAVPRLFQQLWKGPDGRSWDNGVRSRARTLVDRYEALEVSLIYSNTITNGEVLAALAPLGVPVISHVHELDYWMSYRMPGGALQQAREQTDLFIAASNAVARSLTARVGAAEDRIVTVHESIDVPDLPLAAAKREARARWGLPEDAFVVGCSGTMDWRKGVELLAPLAVEVERRGSPRPTHWMWVGGEREGPAAGMLHHDFSHCGLAARLHLTGSIEAPLEAFTAFDAFVVLSREDAFPLVMLEAAALGLPVLCFNGGGGAPEFVRDDAGFVVPYLDLGAMAAHIAELGASPERRRALGNVARQRVLDDHDAAVVAPRILDLIQQVQARGRR